MRICYVTETFPPEVNGVATTGERVVRGLRERGHDVHLVRPQQPGEASRNDADEWRTAGAPIPLYPQLRYGVVRKRAMQAQLARIEPDVVHVATPGPLGRSGVFAAAAMGVPATTDFRTNFDWYSRYYRLGFLEPAIRHVLRSMHNRAECTFVPTRAMQHALDAQGFERLEVIGRGVDCQAFSPLKRSEALRASWGVTADDEPVLVHVGRLAAEKNAELALKAHAALLAVQPAAKLIVVGDGPLRARLEAQYPAARFVGALRGEALAAHYASADILLFPSESETFGNVTLEAMAAGLCVIAFDLAAASEHIVNDCTGWLVRPGAEDAFICAAIHAARLPAQARSLMGQMARQRAEQATWPQVVDQFARRLAHHATGAQCAKRGHGDLA